MTHFGTLVAKVSKVCVTLHFDRKLSSIEFSIGKHTTHACIYHKVNLIHATFMKLLSVKQTEMKNEEHVELEQ